MAAYNNFINVQVLGNEELAQVIFQQLFEESNGKGSGVDSDSVI